MDVQQEVTKVLAEVLHLQEQAANLHRDTPLLGALPELDSIAVVGVITTLEERFGFTVDDDEFDGSNFATVGALSDFVSSKLETAR